MIALGSELCIMGCLSCRAHLLSLYGSFPGIPLPEALRSSSDLRSPLSCYVRVHIHALVLSMDQTLKKRYLNLAHCQP